MQRKRILFVNPHIEDFAAYDHFAKPLGLLWLASYVREWFDVDFINALNRENPREKPVSFKEDGTGNFPRRIISKPEELADIPRNYKRYGLSDSVFLDELEGVRTPDYIFLSSAMTYWYGGVLHTLGLLRQVFPHVPVFLGGIYAALLPRHAQENIPVDAIVPFQDLNSVLDSLEALLGVEFKRRYRLPSYDLLGEYRYLPLLTSSGCVYACSYCASHDLTSFCQYEPTQFADLIEAMVKTYGTKNFAFYDDALLVNSQNHLDPFLRALISKNLGVRLYTPNGLHVRFLTQETAKLMKAAGFVDIRLSVESTDPVFLETESPKSTTIEFERAIDYLRKAGFSRQCLKAYLLLNVPGQAPFGVEASMKEVYEIGAQPMLAFYSPIPGTPDFERAKTITSVDEPLFQNNTVYLYRSGFDMDYYQHLKDLELSFRREAQNGKAENGQ